MKFKKRVRGPTAMAIDSSTVDDRLRRQYLNCSFCPPHKGENAKRTYGRHGPKKKRGHRR